MMNLLDTCCVLTSVTEWTSWNHVLTELDDHILNESACMLN